MKVLSFLLGYLIGSFCISILLSRLLFHTDIRSQGSGNAGAVNAARVFGMGVGIATFAGDFLKTVLAMWLGGLLAGDTGLVLAGFGCLIGHCWPVYFRFRGGKAVSSGAAAALMLSRPLFLLALLAYALGALLSRRASVASLSGAAVVGLGAFFFISGPLRIALAVFAAALIFFMHRSNLRRLKAGTEPTFSFGKHKS